MTLNEMNEGSNINFLRTLTLYVTDKQFKVLASTARTNPNLMAAAPELLEALKLAEEALVIAFPTHTRNYHGHNNAIIASRAAIAKATGGLS